MKQLKNALIPFVTLAWPNFLALITFLALLIGAFAQNSPWVGILGFIGIAAAICGIVLDYRNVTKSVKIFAQPRAIERKGSIANYMHELLQGAGRIVIFTHSMKWVNDDIRGVLLSKASTKSLTIIMKEETESSRQLQQAGADIFYYGQLTSRVINSRFTLINADSQSVELAIGRSSNDVHTIHRYSEASDHALAMALDMFKILESALIAERSHPNSVAQGEKYYSEAENNAN